MQAELDELLNTTPPTRHGIVKLGVFAYYWIWINEGTDHQHRCWILNWRTSKRLIHLAHWNWWTPIWQFPIAMFQSIKITMRTNHS